MIKKKKEEDKKRSLQERIRAKLEKKFGKEKILVDKELTALAEIPHGIIPHSLMLCYLIGRPGLPAGRLTEIIGSESSAKSTLGYAMLAECQKQGGYSILIENEEAFETSRLRKLGINVDELLICQPDHMEEVFEMMETNILEIRESGFTGPICIVWDSVAGTPTQAELAGDYDDKHMGAAARCLSSSLRKFTRIAAKHKATCIFLNQMKTNLDKYSGEKWLSYGGKALKFHSSVRLRLKTRKADLQFGPGKDPVGTNVIVSNVKNKIGIPFRDTSFYLDFSKGIDQYEDARQFGILLDLFKESGRGFHSYGKKKFHRAKFKKFVKEQWGSVDALRNFLLQEAMKAGVLEPYGKTEEETSA